MEHHQTCLTFAFLDRLPISSFPMRSVRSLIQRRNEVSTWGRAKSRKLAAFSTTQPVEPMSPAMLKSTRTFPIGHPLAPSRQPSWHLRRKLCHLTTPWFLPPFSRLLLLRLTLASLGSLYGGLSVVLSPGNSFPWTTILLAPEVPSGLSP